MEANEYSKLSKAFQSLMGMNGDQFLAKIVSNGYLTQGQYDAICDNVYFNSKDSVCEHFGIVHYYYQQGLRKLAQHTVDAG